MTNIAVKRDCIACTERAEKKEWIRKKKHIALKAKQNGGNG
jgi:hypothetical protein